MAFTESRFRVSTFSRSGFADWHLSNQGFVPLTFSRSRFAVSGFSVSRFVGLAFIESKFYVSGFSRFSFPVSRFCASTFSRYRFVGLAFLESGFCRFWVLPLCHFYVLQELRLLRFLKQESRRRLSQTIKHGNRFSGFLGLLLPCFAFPRFLVPGLADWHLLFPGFAPPRFLVLGLSVPGFVFPRSANCLTGGDLA